MSRRALAVTLVLVVVLALPAAGAAGSRDGRSPLLGPDREDAWTELARRPDDRGTVRRALRASILELAGVDASSAEDDRGMGIVYPAGDIDGDGLDEVVEDHWGESVSVVEGATGETIWDHDFESGSGYGFGGLIPAGDLDGADHDDFIMVDIVEDGVGFTYTWTITYRGVRGADGSELWSVTYDNPFTELGAIAYAYVDLNYSVPLDLADVDGDGAADLLHGRYHIADLYENLTYGEVWSTATIFEAISGRSGTVVSTFDEVVPGGSAHAVAVPDLSGDGTADLVGITFTYGADYESASGTITARTGSAAEELWSLDYDGADVPWVRGDADLTGDGRPDLILETYDWDEEAVDLAVVSGADGSEVWSAALGDAWVAPAADVDGDGGGDLLIVDDAWSGSPAHVLLRGADGSELLRREVGGDRRMSIVGDVTGDGVPDLTVAAYAYDPATDEFVLDGPLELASGTTGDTVWLREETSAEAYFFGLGADLSGDGVSDLLRLTFAGGRDVLLAVSGADGSDLWGQAANTGGFVFWLETAVVRPGGGADLLESGWGFSAFSDFDFTGARSGADGTVLWRQRYDW